MALDELAEIAFENAEAYFDTMLNSELAKNIPLVGTAVALIRSAKDYRNRVFARNLAQFVRDVESVPAPFKEKLRAKLAADQKDARRLADTLMVVVERCADEEKAHFLSAVFISYIDGAIDSTMFRRLCMAIDAAFIDDLRWLVTAQIDKHQLRHAEARALSHAGFTMIVPGTTYVREDLLPYMVTHVGRQLRDAYVQGRAQVRRSAVAG